MVEGGKRVETDGPNLLLTQAEKLLVSIKEERFQIKMHMIKWYGNKGSVDS